MAKSRVHKVTITLRFDRPVTLSRARFAAWNHLTNQTFYGYDDDGIEPWAEMKISVSQRG